MLEISGKTNLLEQNAYKYSLQDVAEPNLQRDIYTQGMVPKVPFNHRRVPMNMPEEIWITDTSLRDGQQSVEPYTVDQIVNIYKYLSRLGGPYGIIRQTEFFIYSKKDREALEKCMELGLKFPEITTWIRATKEDFRLVRDLGIRETGILVSCSDYHIFKKMKMTRKQAMDYYLATVADAFEAGVVPRCHLEDITRADFYGFVVPFVNELQKLSRQADIPVKIRACDTMGYGIPYTEAALPRSVAGIIYGLQQYSDVPSECLEWHGHNDFYKAVVNASTAWLYGACAVNCSLLGIGERTGNIPLEAMVFEYASLRGSLDGMDPTVITEIADYFQHEIGYDIPPMTPFVGRDFNATRAGIHADGLLKDAEIYTIFDTEKLLNRPASVQVGKTSGLAGIAYWINQNYHLTGEKQIDKQTRSCSRSRAGWMRNTRTAARPSCPSRNSKPRSRSWRPAASRRFDRRRSMKDFRTVTLADQVFERLESDIIQGVYPRGEVLTELKLVEQLNVSRTPIREALRRLEQEHLIADTGKGSVVLGITAKDLVDIMDIRCRIEGLASYYAAKNVSPEGLARLRHILDLQEFYFEKHDAEHLREMDDQFHDVICDMSGHAVISDTLVPLHRKTRRYRKASIADTKRTAQVVKEHRAIFDAIAAGDADRAAALTTEHTIHAKESMIGRLKNHG